MEQNKKEIKIHKPVLVSENKLELDEDTINYNKNLFEGTDDGFIPMDVDKDVAIQRMSRDLYQFASSGFRELYANEARACRYAKKHHNADPVIVITLDPKKRNLVLEGIDSMGMTAERFKKVFTVLGHSDNFDGTEVGQFGMGRAAYTCLSDTMILETFARESDEKYAVLGRNGLGYQIINKPKLDSYGTRISLTLYDQLQYDRLYAMIVKVCRFSQIKTILNLESEFDSYTKKAGQYIMGPISIQQHVEDMIDKSDHILNIPINLEDELIKLDGYISIDHSTDENSSHIVECYYSGMETYLVNVPIDANVTVPLSYGVVTIKDERKLPPTPDRERLAEKTLEKVNKAIVNLMKTKSGLNLKTLEEFHKSKYRKLYEAFAHTYNGVRENDYQHPYSSGQLLFETLDKTTQNLIEMLRLKVWSKEKQKVRLWTLLKNQTKVFHMEQINKSKIAALEEHCHGCLVFKPEELDYDMMEIFEEFGIISGEEYLEENKIHVHRITEKVSECAVHHSEKTARGYSTVPALYSERIPFSDVTPETIRVDSEFQVVKKVFQKIICSYRAVKDRKDITAGISFHDFIAKIESKKYPTSKGQLSISEIADHKDPVLLEYPNQNLAVLLDTRVSELFVISDADSLFEMAVWLSWKQIEYKFVTNVDSKDLDVTRLVNRYGEARGVSIRKSDYVRGWYNRTEDVPKLLTLLDGILTITDDRILKMFMSATKNSECNYCYDSLYSNLEDMQQYLMTSRDILSDLK